MGQRSHVGFTSNVIDNTAARKVVDESKIKVNLISVPTGFYQPAHGVLIRYWKLRLEISSSKRIVFCQ